MKILLFRNKALIGVTTLLCLYVGFYLFALEKYHWQVREIQAEIDSVQIQAKTDLTVLEQIPKIQMMNCPVQPQILRPETIWQTYGPGVTDFNCATNSESISYLKGGSAHEAKALYN